ncbi:MAG: hypothetical protein ACK4PK_04905 [Alphaproteobacteria bacterium]
MDPKTFEAERKAAFAEIQAAFTKQMDALAKEGVKYTDQSKMSLPEIVEVQEKYRWTPAVLAAAIDLKSGKPLKDIFARVSKRYQPRPGFPRKPGAPPPTEDMQRPAAQSGRDSAFADIRKMLDIAERDFDLTYRPLSRDQAQYFLKKHPIGDESIRFAHKENQRHFMKESIQDVRARLDALQSPPPPAPKAPAS